MANHWTELLPLVCGLYIAFVLQKSSISLCDVDQCPYCYGTDLCPDFRENLIRLQHHSWVELFYNLFSVKNVYFADFNGDKVVLKKLGHTSELQVERIASLTRDDVESTILDTSEDVKMFTVCDRQALGKFLNYFKDDDLRYIYTTVKINVEPLILRIFKNEDGWPLPKFLGACGMLVVEQHCGLSLNYFAEAPWRTRAYLSHQLLESAINFTKNHRDFRLYLTDVSPDNIAVDGQFNLYFVDMENVILSSRSEGELHSSRHFDDDVFVYSEKEVCDSSISDHNIYSVCRLLLSRNAPEPMMEGGLLHSPSDPKAVLLSDLVENCVSGETDRFEIADRIVALIKEVLQ